MSFLIKTGDFPYVSLPEGKFCEFSRIPSSVEVLGHGLESMVLGLSVISHKIEYHGSTPIVLCE